MNIFILFQTICGFRFSFFHAGDFIIKVKCFLKIIKSHSFGKIVLPIFCSVNSAEWRFGNIVYQIICLGKGNLFSKMIIAEFGKQFVIIFFYRMRHVPPVFIINRIRFWTSIKRICVRRNIIDVIINMDRFMGQHVKECFPFFATFYFDFIFVIGFGKNAVVPNLKPFIQIIVEGVDIEKNSAVHFLIVKNKIRKSAITHSFNKIDGIDIF